MKTASGARATRALHQKMTGVGEKKAATAHNLAHSIISCCCKNRSSTTAMHAAPLVRALGHRPCIIVHPIFACRGKGGGEVIGFLGVGSLVGLGCVHLGYCCFASGGDGEVLWLDEGLWVIVVVVCRSVCVCVCCLFFSFPVW